MAIHPRKVFAKMCGLQPRELSVYASRGQVIIVKKQVDDMNPINAEFRDKHVNNTEGKKIRIAIKEGPLTEDDKRKLKGVEEYSTLNKEKKQLETEVLRENIHLLRMKKEKMEGILIPTDLVKKIFEQHFRSVVISFQRGAENIIIEFSKKKSYRGRKPRKSAKS